MYVVLDLMKKYFNEDMNEKYCIRLTFGGISESLKREGQQGLLEEHTWEGCKFLDPKLGSCRWDLHVQSLSWVSKRSFSLGTEIVVTCS